MSESTTIRHPTWLTTGDFTEADEPLRLFAAWFEEAGKSEPGRPEAMSVATVDADGLPNLRMVLMKGFDERGLRLLHQHRQRQGPRARRHRQGRAAVSLEVAQPPGPPARSGASGSATPRPTPISPPATAWRRSAPGPASNRSPLESRLAFEKAIALATAKFAIGTVPRPPNWTGYRVIPLRMEFWQDRPYRLHDRIEFRRDRPGAAWSKTRLYP